MLPPALLSSCLRQQLLPLARTRLLGRPTCLLAHRRAFHASAWRRALTVSPQQFDQVVATARVRMEERARLLEEVKASAARTCQIVTVC
jgi:hypothetical protein